MAQSSSYARFGFDTEFGEAGGPGAAAPKVAGKVLEEARQEAYAQGFAAGEEAGRQQAQEEIQALATQMQGLLTGLQESMVERDKQLLNNTLSLVRLSLHQILGQAATNYPDTLLEHHLRAVQPLIRQEESLTLRIHPGAQGFHEKLKLPHAHILGLPMQIVTDPTLALTDVVVEWKGGGVESKLATHWEALSALLTGAGGTAFPVPDLPGKGPATAPAESPATSATTEVSSPESPLRARAAELLGDEELIDALK